MENKFDVAIYDLEGFYLETINDTNAKQLSVLFNIDYTGVVNHLKGNLLSAGSKYQFKKTFKGRVLKQVGDISSVMVNKSIKIHKYYKGRYITTYNSVTEAAEKNDLDISGVSRVVNGLSNTVGGYTFTKVNTFDEKLVNDGEI